jgi:hypothetical protein
MVLLERYLPRPERLDYLDHLLDRINPVLLRPGVLGDSRGGDLAEYVPAVSGLQP